ncbi:MAG TPA: PqqD family peptide modification chaperone [Kiritimatiellia bacterium]|nr:PqqD family peptide modification chaperone [Kiritimatiellia bacterium]HMP00619.1 PqqD family peptide modification chaperone [Kiritimatiellia bacterium]HMP97768.1 PqqD family peptide modification chaperone [Kiritimatiellia bacterium]
MNPKKRTGLNEKIIGRECYITTMDGSSLTVLNPTALLIWSLCDGEHSMSEIQAILAELYPDQAADRLQTDMERSLDDFRARGLLEHIT